MFAKGKRKTAVCSTNIELKPVIQENSTIEVVKPNVISVNHVDSMTYFTNYRYYKLSDVQNIFLLANLNFNNFTLKSYIHGGGKRAQYSCFLSSIANGILKFIKENYSEDIYSKNKKVMRQNGFVTVDSRQKQSKTPGKPKARRSRQFSKR